VAQGATGQQRPGRNTLAAPGQYAGSYGFSRGAT